jgi:hypothetical protein
MDSVPSLVDHMLHAALPAEVSAICGEVLREFPETESLLVYGSILRGVPIHETLIDVYAIVSSRRGVSPSAAGQFFGNLLPPNVYFVHTTHEGLVLHCKCTVVTAEAFAAFVARDTRSPYFWARFSQPCVLAYARDSLARIRAVELVSQAVRSAYARAKALVPSGDPLTQWKTLYGETYRTEIRPESGNRAGDIVDRNRDYYLAAAQAASGIIPVPVNWKLARLEGKILTVFRLCKAAFTFQGGADYAVWKIERHTGERIELKDWQRKHPIIAGLGLLPRLLRKKVIR